MAFCFGVFFGLYPAKLKAVLSHLPKFRSWHSFVCLPAATCWTTARKFSRKATTFQFIILIHKQSLMFMAGVMTYLWQHYVCFTTPLSSQVLWLRYSEEARRLLAAFPWGSGMFNQLLGTLSQIKRENSVAREVSLFDRDRHQTFSLNRLPYSWGL